MSNRGFTTKAPRILAPAAIALLLGIAVLPAHAETQTNDTSEPTSGMVTEQGQGDPTLPESPLRDRTGSTTRTTVRDNQVTQPAPKSSEAWYARFASAFRNFLAAFERF